MKKAICIGVLLCSGILFSQEDSDSLVSDNTERLFALTPEEKKQEHPYSIWVNGVGLYATQAPFGGNTDFRYNSTGGFAGLDYIGIENRSFGGSVGYLYTVLQESANAGHQNIQNIYLSGYGYFVFSKFSMDIALTPAYLYTTSYRKVSANGFTGTAIGKFPTYEITPHVGLSYAFEYQWGSLCPFFRSDWTINWNSGFTETNAATYNIQQPGSVNSLLQTEVGLNVYEYCDLGERGFFYFRQKVGYLNKAPFQSSTSSGVYVESFTDFTVSISSAMQNLFTAAAEILYQRGNSSGFVNYDLQYGCGFLMQMVTLNVRQNF